LILPEWKLAYYEGILRYELISVEDFIKNNNSFTESYFIDFLQEISCDTVMRDISLIYGILY